MSVAIRVVFVLLIPQRRHGPFRLVSMFFVGLYFLTYNFWGFFFGRWAGAR